LLLCLGAGYNLELLSFSNDQVLGCLIWFKFYFDVMIWFKLKFSNDQVLGCLIWFKLYFDVMIWFKVYFDVMIWFKCYFTCNDMV